MHTFLKNRQRQMLAALALASSAPLALAGGGTGVDYSTLTDAIDFGTVQTGVLGAAAALITVYIVIKGVRLVMGFVRGG